MKQGKKAYTPEEKRAYYMGVGAWIGFGRTGSIQRAIKNMSPAVKKSFLNGFDKAALRKKKK